MSLTNLLAQQSLWTWNIMAGSAQLGEMIREDAITSVNLTMINQAAGETGLSITSFQGAKLEKEFGGDWLWQSGQSAYLVQAKRLDVIRRPDLLAYTIDLAQLNVLNNSATILSKTYGVDAKPAYVFYNSMISGLDPGKYGCTWGNAYVIQSLIYDGLKAKDTQQSCTLTPKMLSDLQQWNPWITMFGSG